MQTRPDIELANDGFEEMYRRELPSMIALGAALSGGRETGAELAQEAMLRAYRDWGRVARMDRPGAWVRRVVINLAADAHRRRQRERHALERLHAVPGTVAPDAADLPFWAAVRSLPERQRAAVALRYIDDLSLDDIARVLDVTTGTIKAALFAARITLARTLGAEGEHHDDDR